MIDIRELFGLVGFLLLLADIFAATYVVAPALMGGGQ